MNRPDLRAAQAAFEKARADVNLARANAWWDVTPQLEYQRIQNDNTIGFGISMPIRIFDRNQGEIARTKAEVQRVSAVSRVVGLQALAEVDTALSTAMTEREKVRRLREVYLPKARQARDTVEFAYRRGGLSVLDFLEAQRSYRETALAEIQALGNYESALNQLESAVGDLSRGSSPALCVETVTESVGIPLSELDELHFTVVLQGLVEGLRLELERH